MAHAYRCLRNYHVIHIQLRDTTYYHVHKHPLLFCIMFLVIISIQWFTYDIRAKVSQNLVTRHTTELGFERDFELIWKYMLITRDQPYCFIWQSVIYHCITLTLDDVSHCCHTVSHDNIVGGYPSRVDIPVTVAYKMHKQALLVCV